MWKRVTWQDGKGTDSEIRLGSGLWTLTQSCDLGMSVSSSEEQA